VGNKGDLNTEDTEDTEGFGECRFDNAIDDANSDRDCLPSKQQAPPRPQCPPCSKLLVFSATKQRTGLWWDIESDCMWEIKAI